MALVLGIILGFILWLANLKPDHYRDPRAKRRPKVTTTTVTIYDGITSTIGSLEERDALEELVLIDDFEEEVLDDEG